jgi:hypothetical protein
MDASPWSVAVTQHGTLGTQFLRKLLNSLTVVE